MTTPVFIQRFLSFSFIALVVVSSYAGAGADPLDLPFSPGEELVYNVRWQQFPAGTCSVKVLPFTRVNNNLAFHFKMTARTSDFVDNLYKIRDEMEGFVSRDFSGSLLYKKSSTGKRKKQVVVEFFREKNEVVYSNFGGRRDPIQIPEHTFDPAGSFFRMRMLDFGVGTPLTFPVTDGKQCFYQTGEVVRREEITTPLGTFDAFVLVPSVTHFSGVFEKSRDPKVRVWISADEKKIPIRIQIQVMVGNIIFDLASYKPGV